MKIKKLAWAVLPLSAAMLLAACGDDSPTPSSTEPTSSETSSTGETINHRSGLVKQVAETAITRDFDSRFDENLEDFTGESLSGASDASIHKGLLREVVDSDLPSFQNSPDAAIFKMASGTFGGDPTLLGQGSIHLKMRVSEGKLSLENLILGIRPSDDNSAHIYPIALSEALNEDSEANPELTNEFQDISVSIGASIEDEATCFPGTELTVLNNSIGFHLYVKNDVEVSAIVEIEEVSFKKGDTTTAIDDFNRQGISGNPNIYWGPTDCADAVLVRRGLSLNKNQKYTTPTLTEAASSKTSVVFSSLGDLSDSKVSVKFDDESETVVTKTFSELEIANAVNGAYANLAIDLAKFAGPEGAKAKTITIENTGDKELQISNVFMTSFEVPDLEKAYPSINSSTAVTFDNFERNFASLDIDYATSHSDPRNVEAGIYHFLSYSRGDKISTSNGVLHLPATEGEKDDDNVNIGSRHVLQGAKYIVFSIKGEEGYDLSNFRFKMSDGGIETSFSNALAMEGVKTYNDEAFQTPYEDSNGFKWYVVDLALNNIAAGDSILLYYAGSKNIDIDSIFYANDFFAYEEKNKVLEEKETDLGQYSYAGEVGLDGAKYFTVKVKGDGKATLGTFRLEYNATTLWIKDGNVDVYDASGRKVDKDEVIPEVETTYYFDITTNFPQEGEGLGHLHVGKFEETDTTTDYGKVNLISIGTANKGVKVDANAASEVSWEAKESDDAFNADSYRYISGWNAKVEAKKMIVHVSGDGTNDLSKFRVEQRRGDSQVAIVYADTNQLLKNTDGSEFDITTKIGEEGVDVVIDLASAGFEVQVNDEIHFHIDRVAIGRLSFAAASAISDTPSTSTTLSQYNQTWAK